MEQQASWNLGYDENIRKSKRARIKRMSLSIVFLMFIHFQIHNHLILTLSPVSTFTHTIKLSGKILTSRTALILSQGARGIPSDGTLSVMPLKIRIIWFMALGTLSPKHATT